MQNKEYVTYKKFSEESFALALGALLTQHDIDYVMEDHSPSFDPFFTQDTLNKEYRIKLLQEDFARAEALTMTLSSEEIETVDDAYYLKQFSNDELMEVLSKPDEWDTFDVVLAQKLLKERGREIQKEEIGRLQSNRLEQLKKSEKPSSLILFAGYIFSLLGGFLGIVIGRILYTQKKTLPNGEKVFAYSEDDRQHGKRIYIIGLLCLVLLIARNLFF
jgi:hypothetical protein